MGKYFRGPLLYLVIAAGLAGSVFTPFAYVSADHSGEHTVIQLQEQIELLRKQIEALQKKREVLLSTLPEPPASPVPAVTAPSPSAEEPAPAGGGGSAAGPAATAGECPRFLRNLYFGLNDAETGGEISKLQRFLAQDPEIYPEGRITGFFGPLTEIAVKRWQAKHGIISSGDAETTGYGVIGPQSRARIVNLCQGRPIVAPLAPPVQPAPVAVAVPQQQPQPPAAEPVPPVARPPTAEKPVPAAGYSILPAFTAMKEGVSFSVRIDPKPSGKDIELGSSSDDGPAAVLPSGGNVGEFRSQAIGNVPFRVAEITGAVDGVPIKNSSYALVSSYPGDLGILVGQKTAYVMPAEQIRTVIGNNVQLVGATDIAYDIQTAASGLTFNRRNPLFMVAVDPASCGGASNPMHLGPDCFLDPADKGVRWGILFHEMGHLATHNSWSQYPAGGFHLALTGGGEGGFLYQEANATLVGLYTLQKITSPGGYGLNVQTLEGMRKIFQNDTQQYTDRLREYERNGALFSEKGSAPAMTPDSLDGIYISLANESRYGWELVPRFIKAFKPYPDFDRLLLSNGVTAEELATFHSAALTVAAGIDTNGRFKQWNFPINDLLYSQLLPVFKHLIDGAAAPTPISSALPPSKGTLPELNIYLESQSPDTIKVNGGISGEGVGMPRWNWGDGASNYGFFPQTHTYVSAGRYTISVSVSNSAGEVRKDLEAVIKTAAVVPAAPTTTATTSPATPPSPSASAAYPGFFIQTDKQVYGLTETVQLTLTRADNKTEPHAVDIYAVKTSGGSKALVMQNAGASVNTRIPIVLGEHGIFGQGGDGDYFLIVCSAGCDINTAANTNSVFFTLKGSSPAAGLPSGLSLTIVSQSGRSVTVNGGVSGASGPLNWDWGDGTPQTDSYFPATHSYAQDGRYGITVTASNSVGAVKQTVEVTVGNPPPWGLLWIDSQSGLTVTINGAVQGAVGPMRWDWGDGTPQTDSYFPATHTYAAGGFYTVTVTASNFVGSTQKQIQVTVSAPGGLGSAGAGGRELANILSAVKSQLDAIARTIETLRK